MIRLLIFLIPYLAIALALERAVLDQVGALASGGWDELLNLPLLAMTGLLAGMLFGELPALLAAVLAALLFGFGQVPGSLGAALISFGTTAWAAGWLTRRLRLTGALPVGFWLLVLLAAERVLWLLARLTFYPKTPFPLTLGSLGALLITAAIGALLYRVLAPRLKRVLMFETDEE